MCRGADLHEPRQAPDSGHPGPAVARARETIFDRFDTIRVSHAAILMNDDDRQVLLHQLEVERPDTFVVEYL